MRSCPGTQRPGGGALRPSNRGGWRSSFHATRVAGNVPGPVSFAVPFFPPIAHRYVEPRSPACALSVVVGAVALGDDGPALMDRALQTRVSFAEVRAAHYRSFGIQGSTRAGHLLRAAADRSAAESERILIRLLKSAGISGFTVNYLWNPAGRSTLDVAFVLELVAIEIDGWAWHHSPDRFQRDRRKQNDLVAQGWTVSGSPGRT